MNGRQTRFFKRMDYRKYLLFLILGACLCLGYCQAGQEVEEVMANLIDIDHDSGGNPGDHWTSVSDAGGALSVSAAAGLNGTANGLQDDITVAAWSVFESSLTPPASNQIRVGFNYDVSNLTFPGTTPGAGDYIYQLDMGGGGDTLFILRIRWDSDDNTLLWVQTIHTSDGASPDTVVDDVIIPSSGCLEVRIVRESSDGAADGEMQVYANTVEKYSTTIQQNFNSFGNYSQYVHRGNGGTGSFSGNAYSDEFLLDDDADAILNCVAVFSGYDLVVSSGGNMKSSIAVAADGQNIFFALEDNATGNQVILAATRPSAPTVSKVYDPGGGSAANVFASGDRNKMVFGGNFATDVVVIDHDVDAATNTDISPAGAGADVVSPIKVDPSNPNHIIAINKTDEDALETTDNGASWSTLNAALGIQIVAMDAVFFGAFFPVGAVYGGNDGVDENVTYSPNDFANGREDTPAGLKAAGAITGIDLALDID